MKSRLPWLACLLATLLQAQEADETITAPAAAPRIVLEQTVVLQHDGGTVTFQKVVPPPTPAPVIKAPAVLTAEELATQQRQEGKERLLVSLSATVRAGGTVLYCTVGTQKAAALSRLDFRLLEGTGTVETETQVLSLFLAAGADDEALPMDLVTAAASLPADGFALLEGPQVPPAGDQAVAALTVLHAFVSANQTSLMAMREQREAERAARALAERNAPPPPPRHSVIQFWPLSAEQKIALRAVHHPEPAPAQPQSEPGAAEQPVIETSPTGGTN